MHQRTLVGLCTASLLATLASPFAVAADACVEHFSADSGMMAGGKYATWAGFPTVTPAEAFERAHRYTVAQGWTINSADANAGVIVATEKVSVGKGKTAPLLIFVEKEQAGAKVHLVFEVPNDSEPPAEVVQQHFCKTLAAVATP